MAKAQTTLELRPAIIADGEKVADLETAWTPDDPRDPEMLHFRWTFPPAGEVFTRMMGERDGVAIAFLYGGHMPWGKTPSGSARCVSCSIQRPGAKRTTNSSSMQGRPGSVQSAASPVWRECGRTSRTTSECSSAEATAKCGAPGCGSST